MLDQDYPHLVQSFTASDGYAWKYRRFPALGSIRARIVGVHGIESHSGWYVSTCTRLSRAGFEVSFLDRRGSGMNMKDRGHAPSWRRLARDIGEYLWWLRHESGKPIYLWGISWGGKLVTAIQRFLPGVTDGLILTSPGFFPTFHTHPLRRAIMLVTAVVAHRAKFATPFKSPSYFTETLHWKEFVRHDPLATRAVSVRLIVYNVRLNYYMEKCPPHIRMPVLVLLAEHDRIIDNERTRRYVAGFATEDKEIIEYPGAHHTLEFEPDPAPMQNDMLLWLHKHCA